MIGAINAGSSYSYVDQLLGTQSTVAPNVLNLQPAQKITPPKVNPVVDFLLSTSAVDLSGGALNLLQPYQPSQASGIISKLTTGNSSSELKASIKALQYKIYTDLYSISSNNDVYTAAAFGAEQKNLTAQTKNDSMKNILSVYQKAIYT